MDGREVADALLAAMEAQRAAIDDPKKGPLEGDRDVQRISAPHGEDTEEDIKTEAAADALFLKTRLERIETARAAVQSLVDHDFPNLPVREVAPETYEKLLDQRATLDAALARFTPRLPATQATIGGLTTGTPRAT